MLIKKCRIGTVYIFNVLDKIVFLFMLSTKKMFILFLKGSASGKSTFPKYGNLEVRTNIVGMEGFSKLCRIHSENSFSIGADLEQCFQPMWTEEKRQDSAAE